MKIAELDWREWWLDSPMEMVLRADREYRLSVGMMEDKTENKYPWWAKLNDEFNHSDRCLPVRAELTQTLFPGDDDYLLSEITEPIYSGTKFLITEGDTDAIERGEGVSGTVGLPCYLVYNHLLRRC